MDESLTNACLKPIILLPALNEEKSIGSVLAGCRRTYPKSTIVVVDNGSIDSTSEIAYSYDAHVLYEPDSGYAKALICGYRYVLSQPFSALVQLDADGQHPYWLIPRLLETLHSNGVDWVVGSRQGTGSPGGFFRRGGAYCMSALARGKGMPFQDLSSGFWALKPSSVEVLLGLMDTQCVDANLRFRAGRMGLSILETPTPMSDRHAGESMHQGWRLFGHGLKSAWKLLRC